MKKIKTKIPLICQDCGQPIPSGGYYYERKIPSKNVLKLPLEKGNPYGIKISCLKCTPPKKKKEKS